MVFLSKKRNDKPDLFAELQGKGIADRFEVPLAVMVPMVVMMWADQDKAETEARAIHAICEWSPIFANHSRMQVEALIDQADALFHEMKAEPACLKAAAALSKPLRQTAYAFAMQVLFADDKVADLEKAEAAKLATWLEIESALARDILKVVSILRHDRDTR